MSADSIESLLDSDRAAQDPLSMFNVIKKMNEQSLDDAIAAMNEKMVRLDCLMFLCNFRVRLNRVWKICGLLAFCGPYQNFAVTLILLIDCLVSHI